MFKKTRKDGFDILAWLVYNDYCGYINFKRYLSISNYDKGSYLIFMILKLKDLIFLKAAFNY